MAINLHDDLKLTFTDSDFIYAGGVSMYVNKHKFVDFYLKKDIPAIDYAKAL